MSTLHANTVETSSSGPVVLTKQEALKFWVNYDGPGNAVRDSLNQSSVTDDGTGLFDYVYTTNFADANYCRHGMVTQVSGGTSSAAGHAGRKAGAQETNQSAMTYFENNSNTFLDVEYGYAASNGDLA